MNDAGSGTGTDRDSVAPEGSPVRYAALVRGINVGRAKRVSMFDLRRIVEQLGYRDVRTLMNSGNVVFSGAVGEVDRAAGGIEEGLFATLGIGVRVTVLTADEVAAVIESYPWRALGRDPSRVLVSVPLDRAGNLRLGPIAAQDWNPEELRLGVRVAYLWVPGGVHTSAALDAVQRALGDRVTIRNWATMTKLARLLVEANAS